MATLTATTAFGASYRDAAMKLAPTYGISIVADEKFGPKDVDMTVQLTRIKASGAQAIFGCSIGPTQVVILRNWRDLAMTNIPFFQSFGFGTRRNIELAAGAAEGVYTQVSGSTIARILPDTHVQKNVAMEYTIAYESKYNAPVDMFGSCAWDGFMLYVDALKQVGEKYTNLPKLRKAIRDHVEARKGFVGQNGVFNFSPTAHVGLSKDAYSMVIIKGKDFLLVE